MAKYGRFDPSNKKKNRDKYRAEKKVTTSSTIKNKSNEKRLLREIERRYS